MAETPPDKELEHLQKLAVKLANKIYGKNIKPGDLDPKVIKQTANMLFDAIEQGYGKQLINTGYNSPDADMLIQLRNNTFRFASAKNYQEVIALSDALKDPKTGQARSFKEFEIEAAKINNDFNKNWLQNEYNQAMLTSTRIADYDRLKQLNRDIYPSWRYKTKDDGHVRPAHQALHDMIFPADDNAFNSIWPPNGWNCRCWVEPDSSVPDSYNNINDAQTALQNTPVNKSGTTEWDRMQKYGFNKNPATDKKVFADKHPYYTGVPAKLLNQVKPPVVFADENPANYKQVFKSNVNTTVDLNIYHDKKEKKNNISIAKIIAKIGFNVKLLPRIDKQNVKSPDANVNTKNFNENFEFKTVKSDKPERISDNIKDALHQSNNILIAVKSSNITPAQTNQQILYRVLRTADNRKINHIWIIYKDILYTFTKNDVIKPNFNFTDYKHKKPQ